MSPQDVISGIHSSGRVVYKIEMARDEVGVKTPPIIRYFDLVQHQEHTMMGRSQSNTLIIRLGEDASGNLYLLGKLREGKSWDFIIDTTPPLCMPAKISWGSAWQYTAHYASGSNETIVYSCLGSEHLKTPAGEYDAYKLKVNMTFSQIPDATGYVWISPNLPYVFELRSEVSSTEPVRGVSQRMDMVSTLESVKMVR